ncbi:hypothetical protein BC793_104204 [Actinoplanes xinjiangensis]|uniref:Uncharacterized protein n=1 Tax=Actinoplanes xinjiangensis TaxID=512350 RepID=A0A316FKS1_9ACTN|nr:hypothetical protein BC793_104204 [Actinoplanes xinjiangensis]
MAVTGLNAAVGLRHRRPLAATPTGRGNIPALTPNFQSLFRYGHTSRRTSAAPGLPRTATGGPDRNASAGPRRHSPPHPRPSHTRNPSRAARDRPRADDSHPAGPHRCLNRAETTLTASRISPAGSHRCLKHRETAVTTSRISPAGSHRCLKRRETTVTTSRTSAAGSHRCLERRETAVGTSRASAAGFHRCLERRETAVGASRASAAGFHRCLERRETAVGASRACWAVPAGSGRGSRGPLGAGRSLGYERGSATVGWVERAHMPGGRAGGRRDRRRRGVGPGRALLRSGVGWPVPLLFDASTPGQLAYRDG